MTTSAWSLAPGGKRQASKRQGSTNLRRLTETHGLILTSGEPPIRNEKRNASGILYVRAAKDRTRRLARGLRLYRIMRRPLETTLLELVTTLVQIAENEEEVLATATHLINSGQVVLRGNFAGHRIEVEAVAHA